MALIPQEIIEEVMQRADILEIVGEYVPLKRRGRNWFGLCPFHSEDTPSFSVNPEKQIYKCFGCGKGGNVIGFIQEAEHLTFNEAVRRLANRYAVEIPERALSPEEQKRNAERQVMLAAHAAGCEFYAAELVRSPAAQAYMKKRGISAEIAARFGLGYAPEADWQALFNHLAALGYGEATLINCGLVSKSAKNGRCYDKFHGRLIFPIRDLRGGVVAFGGRALGDEEPKYLNSQTTPIYNKSEVLYALDLAGETIRRERQAVIMEGYMDVLTAHSYGVTNAVASLGTAFTAEHARLLNRFAPEPPERLQVVLAFDGDSAGQKAARLSLDKLSGYDFIDPRVLVFPDDLDPDDFLRKYGERGWRRLLDKYCYPALDYLLLKALAKHDIATAAGKGAVVSELAEAVRKTKNRTEQQSFIGELARKLQVEEETIRADLFRGGPACRPKAPPAPAAREKKFSLGSPANRELLLLALSDKKIFDRARAELGGLFASTEEESQLIAFIDRLGAEYDFHPSSLFNYLSEDNEGMRAFLLKLLQTETVEGDRQQLSDDYIRRIKQRACGERLAELRLRLGEAERRHEDITELSREIMLLNQEKAKLSS